MKSIFKAAILAALGVVAIVPAASAYQSMQCRDPWIVNAIHDLYQRMPMANSPTTEECDITHYNGGHWGIYSDLKGYVAKAVPRVSIYVNFVAPPSMAPTISLSKTVPAGVFNNLPQRNINGVREVQMNGVWWLIASGGGNLIASGGGNLLSTNGGNLIASGGGNLVGPGSGSSLIHQDGAGFIGHDSGTSYVIASGAGNLIASGGGNITLYQAK